MGERVPWHWGEGVMAFWRSSNFHNNHPNPSLCWSVCSLSSIHNCLFRQPVIKVTLCRRDRPGRELITSSLPCTWQISPNLPTHTHTPTQWGEGESRSLQHQSQALSPSYSLGALLMPQWSIDYIVVLCSGSQESNIERKQGWRNQKSWFAWNQGLWWLLQIERIMRLVQKSLWATELLTPFSPVWKRLRGWWGCMCSWVRQGEWSILAYMLIAFAHPIRLALDWYPRPHKDRAMFWAAMYPRHLVQCLAHCWSSVNSWQINKWIKIMATIYWATINLTWVIHLTFAAT